MQAANEGARLADPEGKGPGSVGIRVELPFEQDVNAFVTEAFEHKTFFTRLHHFVLVSDAFIVTPGGIGTAGTNHGSVETTFAAVSKIRGASS